jgi:hypothetical protein
MAAHHHEERKSAPRHRDVPTAIALLLCGAFMLLNFDQKDYSSWPRLAVIWSTALGSVLLTYVIAYLIKRRKKNPRPTFSRVVSAFTVIACCCFLMIGVRDTWRALDPNQWLEIEMEYARFPFEIEPGQTFYTLDLNPRAAEGLYVVYNPNEEDLLWPDDRPLQNGEERHWWGWLCTIRNRGYLPLTDLTFDLPIKYEFKQHNVPTAGPDRTVQRVSIPALVPDQRVKLLLGSIREDLYVSVYKPKTVIAYVGKESNRRTLGVVLIPFEKFWDGQDYWFVPGPDEHATVPPSASKKSN